MLCFRKDHVACCVPGFTQSWPRRPRRQWSWLTTLKNRAPTCTMQSHPSTCPSSHPTPGWLRRLAISWFEGGWGCLAVDMLFAIMACSLVNGCLMRAHVHVLTIGHSIWGPFHHSLRVELACRAGNRNMWFTSNNHCCPPSPSNAQMPLNDVVQQHHSSAQMALNTIVHLHPTMFRCHWTPLSSSVSEDHSTVHYPCRASNRNLWFTSDKHYCPPYPAMLRCHWMTFYSYITAMLRCHWISE